MNGFLPPAVSTQAENGIRRSDPESEGMAIRNPINTGSSLSTSWNLPAVGPNKATAAKPEKKPMVAPRSA